MLNVEKYIEGGIVENYVLGIADEQEKHELEALLPLHPELRAAVQLFETDLERHALENAVHPPEKVWNGIRRRIETERLYTNGNGRHNGNGNGNGETFIPIESESSNHIRVHKFWRYVFITVFILSKIFLFFAIYFYFMYKEAAKERDKLQKIQQHIEIGK